MTKTLIIAEAGVNHNGDIERAKLLIDAAAKAKVDFVKFQSFKADKLVSASAEKADYQKINTNDFSNTQFEMLKALELSNEDHEVLIEHCKKRNVQFLSTAFDIEGLEYLNSLGFKLFKIPSGEITNFPYLRKLAEFRKPVILSTGMANLDEIKDAMNVLKSNGLTNDNITVLHCNTEYPTPMEDVNLNAMNTIGNEFNVRIGYSDHTLGIEIPIAAVALGAKVIEKHFTLDRSLPGPDHRASLEPNELVEMVESIRNIELATSGDGIKKISKSESKNISVARKSIHLKTALKEGEIISEENLIALRPGTGISPMKWNEIIGKRVKKSLGAYTMLSNDDLE